LKLDNVLKRSGNIHIPENNKGDLLDIDMAITCAAINSYLDQSKIDCGNIIAIFLDGSADLLRCQFKIQPSSEEDLHFTWKC